MKIQKCSQKEPSSLDRSVVKLMGDKKVIQMMNKIGGAKQKNEDGEKNVYSLRKATPCEVEYGVGGCVVCAVVLCEVCQERDRLG